MRRGQPAAGLLFAAISMRPQLVGVTPLLPEIQRDLGVAHAVTGLLVAIPVVSMGLFAPLGRVLLHRLEPRPAVALVIGSLTVAGVARAVMPGTAGVILLTFPIGIGMALAGVVLPVATRERFPARPAFGTGVYATGLTLGASFAALAAVPLARTAGLGWRGSLGVLAALGGLTVPVWLALAGRPARDVPMTEVGPLGPLWRRRTIWTITVIFALVALTYYGFSAWLADAYVERGWTESAAGALVSAFFISNIPGSMVASWLGDRFASRSRLLAISAAVFAAGILVLITEPALAWPFAIVGGVGEGALFSLALTLPLDVGLDRRDVARVSAFMLGVGYTIGASAPVLLGALRDLSGTFSAGLWLVFALAAANVAVSASFRVRVS